jgi:Cu-Zn family superoxide dismutase
MKKLLTLALILITLNLTFCCASKKLHTTHELNPNTSVPKVMAQMESRSDSKVQGTIVFTQHAQHPVTLQIDLTGFPPNSTHAFHIHAYGDCSDAGAASAGPHFNPTGSRHGGPEHDMRHAGDMGNLVSDEKGEVHVQKTNTLVTLEENVPHSAIGKSVIIHQGVDDFETQPTGNAGARISCGVIVKK